jgi:hypothetical protein
MVLFNGENLDNLYTWLVDDKYQDPKHVFSVQNGTIKVSGEQWGGLTTTTAYREYHMVVEWRWGGPNLERAPGTRVTAAFWYTGSAKMGRIRGSGSSLLNLRSLRAAQGTSSWWPVRDGRR